MTLGPHLQKLSLVGCFLLFKGQQASRLSNGRRSLQCALKISGDSRDLDGLQITDLVGEVFAEKFVHAFGIGAKRKNLRLA